jgi:hypothetical protein
MAGTRAISTSFEACFCPNVEHVVKLTIARASHTGEVIREELSNCASARECGVETDRGDFHWRKCCCFLRRVAGSRTRTRGKR